MRRMTPDPIHRPFSQQIEVEFADWIRKLQCVDGIREALAVHESGHWEEIKLPPPPRHAVKEKAIDLMVQMGEMTIVVQGVQWNTDGRRLWASMPTGVRS